MIIEYLTDLAEGKVADLANALGISTSRVKTLIYDLLSEEIIVAEDSNKNRVYKLKA